ncbi:Holliday junction resolvase RuvX [Patescibacteria group bacterium]|nr:Holliday junction resolvase RuvX [Patescibacteria group bacterium]MBU1034516.1 Holliday junction resolvase RuvX [Patescibacteria group bacterium]MBU1629506.1 Holliday junction resolvase RuvX [Patescibacteria group bacterium]MBU1907866.1 Holliday junction resolvase RuvX [Patescibacteria group bacterium]
MRLLGIDYGSKRVGIALGDTETKIATPWEVLLNDSRLNILKAIHEIAEREGVEKIVVGVPRPLKDQTLENEQVKEIRLFIKDLEAQGIAVVEADETLTSKLAAGQMVERGEKGKRDDLAATAILQGWLEKSHLSVSFEK